MTAELCACVPDGWYVVHPGRYQGLLRVARQRRDLVDALEALAFDFGDEFTTGDFHRRVRRQRDPRRPHAHHRPDGATR